jgi:hypothetical protein
VGFFGVFFCFFLGIIGQVFYCQPCEYYVSQVGHMERNMYRAGGASCALLQPLLDNQVGLKNMDGAEKVPIPLEKVP